uniref:Uncharacterized protein n=1 Tax=Anguilla anguilla TaxID=7936 RepID=A0A0E9QEN3_ANGAN
MSKCVLTKSNIVRKENCRHQGHIISHLASFLAVIQQKGYRFKYMSFIGVVNFFS